MNTMPDVLSENFPTELDRQNAYLDAEPSNIISLAQEGLILPSTTRLPSDFVYDNYSPLNEW